MLGHPVPGDAQRRRSYFGNASGTPLDTATPGMIRDSQVIDKSYRMLVLYSQSPILVSPEIDR